MSIPTFTMRGRKYRLAQFWRKTWEYGYTEPTEDKYIVLQVCRCFLWFTVRSEMVPSWAWIHDACIPGGSGYVPELIRKYGKKAL